MFYDPNGGVYRGRDEIDRIAGAIKGTHPDFRYQPIAEPEELGNGGRVQSVSGRPGEAPAYAGIGSRAKEKHRLRKWWSMRSSNRTRRERTQKIRPGIEGTRAHDV